MNANAAHSSRPAPVAAPSLANAPIPTTSRQRERGVALVLVLVFIALCTVLVVAFLASVFTEGVSARAAASNSNAAQLAGSAVQLVEGTISFATQPRADTTFAWACQPGMIRTYGSGTPHTGPGGPKWGRLRPIHCNISSCILLIT